VIRARETLRLVRKGSKCHDESRIPTIREGAHLPIACYNDIEPCDVMDT